MVANWPTGSPNPGTTGSSLLNAVRLREALSWQRLVDLYGPLIYGWCRTAGCQPNDAADLVQDVFVALERNIDSLRHDKQSNRFRAWLRTVTRNKIRDHYRANARTPTAAGGTNGGAQLANVPSIDSADDDDAQLVELANLLERALQMVKDDFEDSTWQAFWLSTVDGRSTPEIAAELHMTHNAIRQAKFRVIKRLRDEFGDLV
ncbi:MAG: sigma-70 family RNA polymerase sigma factor [Planctomycetota bacterium]